MSLSQLILYSLIIVGAIGGVLAFTSYIAYRFREAELRRNIPNSKHYQIDI